MSSSSDQVVVPHSLKVAIDPILRVAKEVEPSNPRVAYLCRFYALEITHKLDSGCRGEGVLRFKTALLEYLTKENDPTRAKENDVKEMRSFYQQYMKAAVANSVDNREKCLKAKETSDILFDVLKYVNPSEELEREVSEERDTGCCW